MIALCFIISGNHVLVKEHIWKQWIQENQDILRVFFYYEDERKIKSEWIVSHLIPKHMIMKTSYYHVVPAYFSLLNYVYHQKDKIEWFCFLTDTCCPIVSPSYFKKQYDLYKSFSIMEIKSSFWNVDFHKRANLRFFPKKYHLFNSPWFILSRENVLDCFQFLSQKKNWFHLICQGGLANESLFAIILTYYNKQNTIINTSSHLTDWSDMSSKTSPHLFQYGTKREMEIIKKKNKYQFFIRKINVSFPNDLILQEIV
jgi:hypothetical protein